VSSTDGFPVELVYATRVPSLGALGAVRAQLPRPDFLVTESKWDLFVPDGYEYGRPNTNMELVLDGRGISKQELEEKMGQGFEIHVPSAGRNYSFEMLYPNHGDVDAYVTLPYRSRAGTALGQIVSLVGVFLSFVAVRVRAKKRLRLAAAGAGLVLLLAPVTLYGVGGLPALVLATALGLLSGRQELRRLFERIRRSRPAASQSPV
jgi:hypothetical protein